MKIKLTKYLKIPTLKEKLKMAAIKLAKMLQNDVNLDKDTHYYKTSFYCGRPCAGAFYAASKKINKKNKSK